MALLLAVLQPLTLMILQKPMFPAEVSSAEATIAYDTLRSILAVLEAAADFLRGHAPAHGQRHVQRRVGWDREIAECR